MLQAMDQDRKFDGINKTAKEAEDVGMRAAENLRKQRDVILSTTDEVKSEAN